MDYSKYKYEQEQKQKLARKHQSTITIKEIKLRPKIDPHDYETKKGHVLRFLRSRDKVKVTIMFRGREMYHPERGRSLLLRLAEDVKDLAMIESDPLQDGRNMVMMLAPHKEAVAVKPASEAGDEEGGAPSEGGERSEAASSETAPAPETPEDETPEAASPEPESDPEPEVEAEAQAETPATPA
jgi:translation initiation factor IF-3